MKRLLSLPAVILLLSAVLFACAEEEKISGMNAPPVADAGQDQNIVTGSTVTVDGSGSSAAHGCKLTYGWSFTSKPAGSAATLSGTAAVNPAFTADIDGSYVLSLTVNDGTLSSAPERVTITATTGNAAPVARAGMDQSVITGSLVTLDGSNSSDANGDALTYSWSFTSVPALSSAALSSTTSSSPTFTADKEGSYVLSLTVNDGTMDSAADTITITAATTSANGALDTAFGGMGYVVHRNAAGGIYDDVGKGVSIDSSGRVVVAGYSTAPGGDYSMAIWRYKADGTLDTSFNGTGYVIHDNAAGGNSGDYGNAVKLDSSGKIVVAGYSAAAGLNNDMVIWRYKADGTLDDTFNGTGFVTHNNAAGGNGYDTGNAVTSDSSGKILVAGQSLNAAGNYDMVIWRYKSDGALDTSFNGTGYVVHNNAAGGNGHDNGNAIAIDSSGRIVVAGYSRSAASWSDMTIWRYDANGTLDTTFNGTGYAVHGGAAGGSDDDIGYSITFDSSKRILVAGSSRSAASGSDMTIWRYNANGTLDTSFNGTGYVTHNNAAGGNFDDEAHSITLDSSGRMLVAGYSRNAAFQTDMVIWRYNTDGTLDTTFGGGTGYVVHDGAAGGGNDEGYSITLDSSGRIVVAGSSRNGTLDPYYDMVIWRYK